MYRGTARAPRRRSERVSPCDVRAWRSSHDLCTFARTQWTGPAVRSRLLRPLGGDGQPWRVPGGLQRGDLGGQPSLRLGAVPAHGPAASLAAAVKDPTRANRTPESFV